MLDAARTDVGLVDGQVLDEAPVAYADRTPDDAAYVSVDSTALLDVDAGAVLVGSGARKSDLFRVVAGTLAGVVVDGGRERKVVTYVAGDVVGLGRIDTYIWDVRAKTSAIVSRLPREARAALVACEPALADLSDQLTEAEFAELRQQLVSQSKLDATRRVANLLIVLARTNGYEGRDATLISDDIACGAVAGQLGLDVGTLAEALVQLRDGGYVAAGSDGSLRLTDVAALEAFADD